VTRFHPSLWYVVSFLSLALAAPAFADWPQLGRAISTAPNAQVHSRIATDGRGGAIITWQDLRTSRVNIFAQHVLASGDVDALWPVNGRALLTDSLAMANTAGGQTSPLIVSDGAGGAIVAWQDLRSAATETDVFAQHVLASGVVDPAWPANGAALSAIEGPQNTLALTSDGAGGAIVTWVDGRSTSDAFDIFAQHVLVSGHVDPRWPVNGLAVCTAPGHQGFPAIVDDGNGGAIITWEDPRDATSGFDVYAQHILDSGVADLAWPVNGRAVCTVSGDQGRPTIASDGAHGAIIGWTDSRIVGTAHIFAEHVRSSGVVDPAWPAGGRSISNAANLETRPLAVSDGAGGAVVTWQGFTTVLNMYIQHVTAAGVVDPAWPAGGRALSNSDRAQTHATIATDGAGGAVVAWEDINRIVAQHVLAQGALDPTYPPTGRLLSNLPTQGEPELVGTGGGGAIVSWTDSRSGVDLDIFAMQVLEVLSVDVPHTTPTDVAFARPRPNPARGPLTLRFTLPRDAGVRLAIYDLAGRRVRELVSQSEPAGEHVIQWDLLDDHGHSVGVGTYFARLDVERAQLTQKLVRLQ